MPLTITRSQTISERLGWYMDIA